jgi:hypothetical protein
MCFRPQGKTRPLAQFGPFLLRLLTKTVGMNFCVYEKSFSTSQELEARFQTT